MKENSGRLFFCAVFLFIFIGFLAFAEDKTYDLMTEAQTFFKSDYKSKVYTTRHIVIKKIFVLKTGIIYFEIDNMINGIMKKDYLYPFPDFTNFVEYDSDIYKQFDPSKSLVKGRFYIGTTELDPNDPYLIFIDDMEFIQSIAKESKFEDKDSEGRDCVVIDNSGKYKKTLSLAAEAGQQDFKTYMAQDIVSAAVVARNWYDYHTGRFSGVRLGIIDKSKPIVSNIVNFFKGDYLYPFVSSIQYSNGSISENYLVFKNSHGNYVLVLSSFSKWQPN